MKRLFVLGAAIALVLPVVAFAAVLEAGDNPGVSAGETVRDDLYIAGGSVVVAGPTLGDIYAGGGTVVISGAVGGDVVAGGGNVTVTSSVADDVRVGGGSVTLQGSVGGDVLAGGGQITIAGSVGGDVWVGGGSVRVEAPVAGDMRVGGGNVYINSTVAGSVEADAEELTLGPRAVIQGSLKYRSPQEITIAEGARVVGAVTYEPREERGSAAAFAATLLTVWFVGKTLVLIVFALLLGLLFKRFVRTAVEAAAGTPLVELGRGLVAVIVLPIVSIFLLVTILGIPFGILGLLSFVALMIVAWGLTPVFMGALLYHWWSKQDYTVSWKSILLGVLAYTLLSLVPFVGWLVNCLFTLAAVGAVAGVKWQALKEWR